MLSRRERRFHQDARVARFALQAVILRGEAQRSGCVALQVEMKPRFFLLVQFVAAQGGGVEALFHHRDVRCRARQLRRLFGQGEAQQQDVRALPVAEHGHHFRRPVVVEQKIGIGGEDEAVGDAQREPGLEMALGQDVLALAQSHFREPRLNP